MREGKIPQERMLLLEKTHDRSSNPNANEEILVRMKEKLHRESWMWALGCLSSTKRKKATEHIRTGSDKKRREGRVWVE